MIAIYINCIAIIVGTLIGLLIGSRLKEGFKEVVFASSGLVTLVIGIKMALETQSFLVLLFSVIVGGLVGYILGIERGILRLGEWMERKSSRSKGEGGQEEGSPLHAALNASVLFCSGAMAFRFYAGTQGGHTLILL